MNTKIVSIFLVVLNAGGSVSIARPTTISQQYSIRNASNQSEPTLNRRIPPANRRRYEAVQGEQAWRNPFLRVSNRGLELRSLSAPEPRLVALEDLRKVLTDLPISDWPYGRVVVVQSPGIVPAEDGWIVAMERNRDGALEVLKALGADEWGWPA